MSDIKQAQRDGGDASPLGDALGYLLARAGARAIRDLNRELQPLGLRNRSYTALLLASDGPGLSQRDLGWLLGVDPSAVVAIVDDLERDGLVRREPHPDDRRTRLIVATPAGMQCLETARPIADDVDERLRAGLTDQEREHLLRYLRGLANE